MLQLVERLRELEARSAAASAKARPLFDKRGQLLPRERLARLLDAGAPWLELSSLAGWRVDTDDVDKSVPGGGVIAGIGTVSGMRCVIIVSDSGIDAGAIQRMGGDKILRAQAIALRQQAALRAAGRKRGREPAAVQGRGFRQRRAAVPQPGAAVGGRHSGGHRAARFVHRRRRVHARAVGLRGHGARPRESLPGRAAAAEGGHRRGRHRRGARRRRDAHRRVRAWASTWPRTTPMRCASRASCSSGCAGLRRARPASSTRTRARAAVPARRAARRDAAGLPHAGRHARGDRAHGRRFRVHSSSAPATAAPRVCGHAALYGQPVGIITNNGPIDPAGATKATHFIQACCQAGIPLLYLQNTTGYMVGKCQRAGRHDQARLEDDPGGDQRHACRASRSMCGASFGAGNYGMCGRGYAPRFVFSWPNARTAVMGGEQAALTMRIVTEARREAQRRAGGRARSCARWRQPSSTSSRASRTRSTPAGAAARRRRDRPARHARACSALCLRHAAARPTRARLQADAVRRRAGLVDARRATR